MKYEEKIFLGVISSNKGSSNSIRNSQIISKLKAENNKILVIDFGIIFDVDKKIFKIILLIFYAIKASFLIFIKRNSKLLISTNPKWLIFFALIFSRSFTLYLGDPFVDDVAKKNTKFNTFLWNKSKNLISDLFVFSPYLFYKFKDSKELCPKKIKFWQRLPIKNLPKMNGKGLIYLGDFDNIDRNFLPILSVLKKRDIKLTLYGRGKNKLLNNEKNISINTRLPLEQIKKLIPNYKILLIILNRSGLQVPGKIYDFFDPPFPVLILYEKNFDIKLLPVCKNFIYCRNESLQISNALDKLLKI